MNPDGVGHLEETSMSKSHVRELSKVYSALFADATYTFPELADELAKSCARLLTHVEQRGIHVFMVELPAIGKHLTRCLADGQFSLSGLPLTRAVPFKGPVPAFMGELYQLVFDVSGKLRDDYSHEAIFFLRQILICAKKAELPCSPQTIADTVREFAEVDSALPEPKAFGRLRPLMGVMQ